MKESMLHTRLPIRLHQMLRIEAAKKKTTMRKIVAELIERELDPLYSITFADETTDNTDR